MVITMTHVHLLVFGTFAYGIYYNFMKLKPPVTPDMEFNYKKYGGRFKFISFQNLCVQCLFFGVCVLNDFLGSESEVLSQRSALQKFRDWLFSVLILPLGLNIFILFWIPYVYDRELIFPKAYDSFYPFWLTQVMHTLPAVGGLCELYTIYHFFQQGFQLYYPAVVMMLLYNLWVLYVYSASGIWIYKVFQAFGLIGRLLYVTYQILVLLLFVYIGSKIHYKVWGDKIGKME